MEGLDTVIGESVIKDQKSDTQEYWIFNNKKHFSEYIPIENSLKSKAILKAFALQTQ